MTIKDLNNFIQANGRLEYRLLREFAKSVALTEFVKVLDRAVLVGSGIYSGYLEDSGQAEQTLFFNKRYIDQDDDASISLHSAIFYLYKHPRQGKPDIISIGRSETNDLVLDDTPISREHAHIRIQGDRYFLTDFGATNGTMLNERQMEPNTEVELEPGDNIGFGRYQFSFMPPERFFKWVYKY